MHPARPLPHTFPASLPAAGRCIYPIQVLSCSRNAFTKAKAFTDPMAIPEATNKRSQKLSNNKGTIMGVCRAPSRDFQQICEVVPRATNTRESCGPTPQISGPIPLFRVSPDLTRLLQYASGGALLNCFGDLCYASRFAVKDLSTDAALCWSLLFPECICV